MLSITVLQCWLQEANENGRGDGGLDIEEFQAALGQIYWAGKISKNRCIIKQHSSLE